MGKHEKNLKKKIFDSDTNTEIGPWFQFPIPKPGFGRTLLVTSLPPDFHTFLQPEVDLAKKLTGAATAASQLLVCKHHWQLYGAGKSLLQSSKFWAKKTLIHWHPSFSFDFAMAGWLYFLVFVAKFLASTILYVKCEKIIGNKLHFVSIYNKIYLATIGKTFWL